MRVKEPRGGDSALQSLVCRGWCTKSPRRQHWSVELHSVESTRRTLVATSQPPPWNPGTAYSLNTGARCTTPLLLKTTLSPKAH